jgi:Domain of unknown function (DUF4340)
MKRRGLLLLAIVAAALAAYLVVDARRQQGGGGSGEPEHVRALPPFDRKTVRAIEISRQKGEGVSLLHSPAPGAPPPAPAWHIESADLAAADDATVDDLLAAIDLAESDRTADITAAAAGLSPPASTLTIETPQGALTLQLGRPDATGRGVYARAGADGPIRVINRRVLDLVDRDASAFRDRRLFPLDPAALSAIAWHDENGAHELRIFDGRWQNERKEWVADEHVLEALRRLFALRIDRFDHDAVAGGRWLKLTAGMKSVAVEGGDKGRLKRGADAVTVPLDALEAAWRSLAASAARDDRLVAQTPDMITGIELSDARAHLALKRLHGEWTFTSPKVSYAADTAVVDAWLARLRSVKAATKAGGPHARHLTIEGPYEEQVDVSAPPDVFALLAPDPLRFRDRSLLSFARFDVRRLQRTVGKSTQLVTTDDGSTWRAPSGDPVNAPAVAQIVFALSDLRASAFVDAPSGAAAVTLEIDVQPPGEARPVRHELEAWSRNGDAIARLDRDATFTIAPATFDMLRAELLQKSH